MSRLSSSFMNSHKLLVPFITCGDPNADTTVAVAVAAAQAGADAVEGADPAQRETGV